MDPPSAVAILYCLLMFAGLWVLVRYVCERASVFCGEYHAQNEEWYPALRVKVVAANTVIFVETNKNENMSVDKGVICVVQTKTRSTLRLERQGEGTRLPHWSSSMKVRGEGARRVGVVVPPLVTATEERQEEQVEGGEKRMG
jgi:hypothetical protein